MTIKIITDSSSDLPPEIVDELEIGIVPLTVHFGSETMSGTTPPEVFYNKLKQSSVHPTTSSPSPYEFLQMYKQAGESEDILVIVLSSSISSTYQNALVAKEMFHEEGYTNTVEILDSKTGSIGLGLLTMKAAKLAETGMVISDVLLRMKQYLKDNRLYFTLDSPEGLIKGGRLDRVRGTMVGILNIKLLLWANNDTGTIEVLEKVRGFQNCVNRMIGKLGEKTHDFEKTILGISHCNCEERAKNVMKQILEKYPFSQVIVSNMGPVIGSYAGEGAVLIAY